MSINTRKLQLSAAVMLLLAGCGGGSNGSSEPLATNTPAAANTTTTVNSTAAAQPAPSQPATTVSQPSTQPAAQPAAPTAPRTDASHNSAQVTPTQPAAQHPASAISATGITGAVLATMLDQRSTDVGDDEHAAHAYPATLEGRILDGAAAPVVQSVQIRSTPYAGEGQRPGAGGSYTPATGSYTYTTFNGTKVSDGSNPHFEVNSIGMDLEVTNTEHAVTLATHLVALDENGGNYLEGPTYTGAGASIGKSDSIHFGSVVAEWKNGAHNVQLLVNRVADDQAALCWNYHLPDTNRLYCNKWTVPHGWKEGQPLVKAGHYLVEVRDGNTTYWHTRKQGQ